MTLPSEGSAFPTSALLEKMVADHADKERVSVDAITHSLKELGFGVLLAVAALPLCIPLPKPPGYGSLFAIPLFLLALQMVQGRRAPWLPQWLARKQVKYTTLALLVNKACPVLRRVEKILRPRLWGISPAWWEKFVGLCVLALTCSIALPIPFAHTLPGFSVLLMALGLLGRDAAVITLGVLVGAAGLALTGCALYFGTEAAQHILDRIAGSAS